MKRKTYNCTAVSNDFIKISLNLKKIICPLLLLSLCLVRGLQISLYSDFSPINGDFQNYNVCRRLLDGQIPFKDFPVYLGIGHLYLISFFLGGGWNNFTNSIFIVSAVTFACFELLLFTIGSIILKNKQYGILFSLSISLLNIMRPVLLTNNLSVDLLNSLNSGLSPGNSARMIRGFAPVLFLLILYASYSFTKRYTKCIKVQTVLFFTASIFSGMIILWSNDYGIASYISALFLLSILLLKKMYHQKFRNIGRLVIIPFLCYLVISIGSFLLSLFIITRGHITSWFDFTFGASQYQQWYFDMVPESKTFFLYQIDLSFFTILIFILFLLYLYRVLKSSGTVTYGYAAIAFLLLSGFIATNMYHLISGGNSREIAYLFLIAVLSAEAVRLISKSIFSLPVSKITLLIFILALTVFSSAFMEQVIQRMPSNREGSYVKELNGYLRTFPQLQDTKKRLNSASVFSTYASALEVMTDQFQPSGSDYIIHVLGNKQRKAYLKSFQESNFQYATTIRNEYTDYEWWIRNANWFFYRELYKNYSPSFVTEYQTYWEKADELSISIANKKAVGIANAEVMQLSNNSYRISVTTENQTFNGTADICIDYSSNNNASFFETLAFKQTVYVNEITEKKLDNHEFPNFFLPNESKNYYIPITILNGYGEVELKSYPQNCTDLSIHQVSLENVFSEPFSSITLSSLTDNNWVSGIQNGTNTLLVNNTKTNQIVLEHAKSLTSMDGENYPINRVEEIDGYIRIHIDLQKKLDTSLSFPNLIQVEY